MALLYFKEMNRVRFSFKHILHVFGNACRFLRARKEEDLFRPSQIGEETDGFVLPFFIKADEDII